MSNSSLFGSSHHIVMDENEYDSNYVRCVLFRLDHEFYGVNVQRVREVLRVSEIRPVPGAPSDVLGIINVRGVIVTILNTRSFFKLYGAEITDLSRIIIIEEGDLVLGLLVDEVEEVRDIAESRIDPIGAIGEDSNRLIQGIVHYSETNVIIVIDTDRFFEGVHSAGHSRSTEEDLF
jgi:purine-binding chemotaxis protein CheW